MTGTEAGDGILVRRLEAGTIQAIVNDTIALFDRAAVRRVAISGLGDADRLENRTFLRATILGGAGDDAIFPGVNSDTVDGDSGVDRVDYSTRDEPLLFGAGESSGEVVSNAVRRTGGDEFDSFFNVEAIRGTNGDDAITLGGADITLYGGGGNDMFNEFGSVENPPVYKAYLFGEDGNDSFTFFTQETLTINAGPGDDMIVPQSTRPFVLDGGPGTDTIDLHDFGQDSLDLNDYSSMEDAVNLFNRVPFQLIGTPDANRLIVIDSTVQSASITVEGGGGNDSIIGSTGNDSLHGGGGDDLITGGGGNDSIEGTDGADTLRGGNGNDTLIGGAGRDKLYGDAGDDLLLGRGGSKDRLDGGEGDDTASADAGPDVFDLIFNVDAVN